MTVRSIVCVSLALWGVSGCDEQCIVDTRCVETCGDAPTSFGCGSCPEGMLDVTTCQDAGFDAATRVDSGVQIDAGDAAVDAGPPVLRCVDRCTSDEQCTRSSSSPGSCDSSTGNCVPAQLRCDDQVCLEERNDWATCEDDGDCSGTDRCVATGGGGGCAPVPAPGGVCPTAALERLIGFDAYPSGGTVQVCAIPNVCGGPNGTLCVIPCSEVECTGTRICDTDTEQCGCGGDDDCGTGFECDGATNRCHCTLGQACGPALLCRSDGEGGRMCACTDDSACGIGRACDTETGACVCVDDSACPGICDVARGLCTCSDDLDCEAQYEGSMAACR